MRSSKGLDQVFYLSIGVHHGEVSAVRGLRHAASSAAIAAGEPGVGSGRGMSEGQFRSVGQRSERFCTTRAALEAVIEIAGAGCIATYAMRTEAMEAGEAFNQRDEISWRHSAYIGDLSPERKKNWRYLARIMMLEIANMNVAQENFVKQILDHLDAERLSVRAAALKSSVPVRSFQSIIEGKQPSIGRAEEICRALGLEFYIGPPREPGGTDSPATPDIVPPERIPKAITDLLGLSEGADADAVVAAIRAQLAGRGTAKASSAAALDKRTLERTLDNKLKSETRNVLDKLDAIEARLPAPPDPARGAEVVPWPIPSGAGAESGAREGDVRIQLAQDVRTAAGAGEEVFEESTDMHVVLPAEALPRPVRPDRLIALYAEGRSMEPTIRPGEMLVMDRGRCEPREGGIFVLRTDTGLVVKRLKQEGGGWRMTSDNPDWPARDVGQDDRVLGHVVWFGPEKIVEAGG